MNGPSEPVAHVSIGTTPWRAVLHRPAWRWALNYQYLRLLVSQRGPPAATRLVLATATRRLTLRTGVGTFSEVGCLDSAARCGSAVSLR